jgi:ATP-binding cassette subfamily B protein
MLVRALGGPGVLYFFNAFFLYALGLAYMVSISWRLTLVVFLPLPVIALLVRVLVHRVRDYVTKARVALSDLNTIVQENLSGVLVVKSFGLEEAQIVRFESQSAAYMDFGLREAWTRAQMIPVVGLGGGLAAVFVIGYGGRMVSAGDLSIGDLVAVMSYVGVMVMPTVALGWILSLVQRGAAALERLDEVLAAPVTITSPESACRLGDGPLSIVVKGLTFRYDDHLKNYGSILKFDVAFEDGRRHALREIDFVAAEGGYVAIVGRVGSGKSTLLKAIHHLVEVAEGSVFVGGVDVTKVELDELRKRVGFVPQDDFLFATAVFDNIAYGQPDATRDKVDEAARTAGLLVDLESLPDGLDTLVGERGATLSGGQRQRVAVARAILIDAPILLLDNALSNVDAETERKILDGLRANVARDSGRTLVVVSNRIGAIQDADRIYVMDEGRIVDHGSHAELIQHPGLYANMFEQQRLSTELEQF